MVLRSRQTLLVEITPLTWQPGSSGLPGPAGGCIAQPGCLRRTCGSRNNIPSHVTLNGHVSWQKRNIPSLDHSQVLETSEATMDLISFRANFFYRDS